VRACESVGVALKNGDKVAGAKRAAVKREPRGPPEEGRVGGGHGEGEGIVMRPEIGHTIDPVKDVLRVEFPSESNTLFLAHARVRSPLLLFPSLLWSPLSPRSLTFPSRARYCDAIIFIEFYVSPRTPLSFRKLRSVNWIEAMKSEMDDLT